MDIDAELEQASGAFVSTVKETMREIELIEQEDPARAGAALKRLGAVVDETSAEVDRIRGLHRQSEEEKP